MSLFKIILLLFLIYFIRRFLQMYRTLKTLQLERELNENKMRKEQEMKKDGAVEADYKVID